MGICCGSDDYKKTSTEDQDEEEPQTKQLVQEKSENQLIVTSDEAEPLSNANLSETEPKLDKTQVAGSEDLPTPVYSRETENEPKNTSVPGVWIGHNDEATVSDDKKSQLFVNLDLSNEMKVWFMHA